MRLELVPVPVTDAHRLGFNREDFVYDAAGDRYICPQDTVLSRRGVSRGCAVVRYQAPATACAACPCQPQCTSSDAGRTVERHFDEAYLDRVKAYHETADYQRAIRSGRSGSSRSSGRPSSGTGWPASAALSASTSRRS